MSIHSLYSDEYANLLQYAPTAKPLSLKLNIGGEEVSEQGKLFSEATFISEC
jgi:hypothetical protein